MRFVRLGDQQQFLSQFTGDAPDLVPFGVVDDHPGRFQFREMPVMEVGSNTLSVVVCWPLPDILPTLLDDPVDECVERQFLPVGVGQYSKNCPASFVCDCRENYVWVDAVVCLSRCGLELMHRLHLSVSYTHYTVHICHAVRTSSERLPW